MTLPIGHLTSLSACMPPGIGELTFGSEDYVKEAGKVLSNLVFEGSSLLSSAPKFTMCFVGHNPPAYLKLGEPLAWNFTINGTQVEVRVGALDEGACDLKVETDHSVLSNAARLLRTGINPAIRDHALQRLDRVGRWQISGQWPEHAGLGHILHELHEVMAPKTMPRFTFMTPEWVTTARHILITRSMSDKYRDAIKEQNFTFSEEFTHTPKYAFPDGAHGGFWVKCVNGSFTVGAGPLPESLGPADMLTKGQYTPVVPVGRTVNAAMDEVDQKAQRAYSRVAFAPDGDGKPPVNQSSPSGGGPMSQELGRIFIPLHDELSKRTSSELPLDFEQDVEERWADAQPFDRDSSFDKSWLCYDTVDIYGNPRD